MYTAAVLGTLVLMFLSAVDYVRRAWVQETNPVLGTWILMMVMMGLSFWMYWESPEKSLTGNMGVVAGVLNVAIILTGVIATNIRHDTLKVAFDNVQKRCFCASGIAVLVWVITNKPIISYTMVQLVAVSGLFATAARLWRAEKSTEPLFLWVSVFLANLCAAYPAWVHNDIFSWIYLCRAIPSTGIVIYLIVRIKRKMRT